MVAGSVSVASDESRTGTGMALAIYDADFATLTLPPVPTLGSTAAPWNATIPVSAFDVLLAREARVKLLQERARQATAQATAIVGYIQANATAGGDPVT
jgi:hypothetical protein